MTLVRGLDVVATLQPLADFERRQLDVRGYVTIPNALDPMTVADIRVRVDELIEAEGDTAGIEVHLEPGTHRLADLVNKGEAFDRCWTQPAYLAVVKHVLGGDEIRLSSLNARVVPPGQGFQPLHVDWWSDLSRPGEYRLCNSIWMIDDFTESNGPTRVVPGSHTLGCLPETRLRDRLDAHPHEVSLIGKAGTAVVFHPHLWHRGSTNLSGDVRRALHCCFVPRDEPQQTDQLQYLRRQTSERLSAAQKYLLDV